MKKIRAIFIACLLFFSAFFTAGCYITQAQPMKNVKGTYELTNYTITEQKKHSDGVVRDTTTNMLESRGMVTYLVITGTGTGYYVYKTNDVAAYAREVLLSYEKSEEETSKYKRVGYKDYTSSEYSMFGITKGALNFSKPPIFISNNIRTDGVSKSWKKVDKATDLSYVKKQLGEIPCYTLEGYQQEGGYNVHCEYNTFDNPDFVSPYAYYYVILDTAKMQATSIYANAVAEGETPVRTEKTEEITLMGDGWNTIKIGGVYWQKDAMTGNYTREIVQPSAYKLVMHQIVKENAKAYIETQINPNQEN